jgi:hypothetical protein
VFDQTTIEGLLTAAGAGSAALLITGIIQLLKNALPTLGDRLSGASMAFTLSAALYLWVGYVTAPVDPNAQLAIVIATGSRAAVQAGVAALRLPSVANKAIQQVANTLGSDPNTTVTVGPVVPAPTATFDLPVTNVPTTPTVPVVVEDTSASGSV